MSPLVRRALAALSSAASVAFAIAALEALANCGSSMSDASFANGLDDGGQDASGEDASTSFDSGNGDAAAAAPPVLVVAHASPDLFDFRMCFAKVAAGDVGDGGIRGKILPRPAWPDDTAGPMPLANYPGVPAGGGAPLPNLHTFDGQDLAVYLVRAKVLERSNLGSTPCDQLLCSGGQCLDKQDYVALPAIDGTKLQHGATYLLAVVGCLPLNASAGASCGENYSMTLGNLHALVMRLDARRPTDALLPIALQIAHAATAVGRVAVGIDTIDAGALGAITPAFGEVAPPSALTLARPAFADYGKIDVHVATVAPDGGADAGAALALSLDAIQKATEPGTLPNSFYEQSSNFVFVVLGDPSPDVAQIFLQDGGANPAYDGHGLHVIALPTASIDARDGGAL